jgi:hypothetical protein
VFRSGLGTDDLKAPYQKGLVIFLVGEQPTGGINDSQFENSLKWISALQPVPPRNLRILGPTFSGSLPSLARELDPHYVRTDVPINFKSLPVLIYSGSANSEDSVHSFKRFLKERSHELTGFDDRDKFRTFDESDSLMTNRFLCYLRHEHYRLDRVAILSEDETAYGTALPWDSDDTPNNSRIRQERLLRCGCNNAGTPISLSYPRDIANLRSAYEQQSIFSVGKKQANTPSTTLRGDLSESKPSEHDTVHTYADQLTPLAQESVLFGIANILQLKKIEFIILRSSNSLDQLFLSEFLRRSYPSGRIVLDGSDLLFRRGMEGASLRGVMLLSTYPLMSWTQDRVTFLKSDNGRGNGYKVFGQDIAEGLYIAGRRLLESPGGNTRSPIFDYAPPETGNKDPFPNQHKSSNNDQLIRPPTWVSVVGHRQFWSIAALNSETLIDGPEGSSLLDGEPTNCYQKLMGRSGVILPGETTGLLSLCLILSLWHFLCCSKGSITGAPRARTYFAPVDKPQHVSLIFLGSLVIGMMGVMLASGSGLITGIPILENRWSVGVGLTAVAIVVAGLSGFVANCRHPRLWCSTSGDNLTPEAVNISGRRLFNLTAGWIVMLVVFTLVHSYLLDWSLIDANRFSAYWRSVHLRSGVSPLLPQILLIIGMYAWFWFTLRGLSLFGQDRPVLPPVETLPQLNEDSDDDKSGNKQIFRMFSQTAGTRIEESAFPLRRDYLFYLLGCVVTTMLATRIALGESTLRTLSDRRYGGFIFVWVCLCIGAILADTLQLVLTWSSLRRLLVFLDRLRLRRTLGCLKGHSWDSVWKMSANVLEERYRLISRQFESARNLSNALNQWIPSVNEADQKRKALEEMRKCETSGREFAKWYAKNYDNDCVYNIQPLYQFQVALAATAGNVMTFIIRPAWQKETKSLLVEPFNLSDKAGSQPEARRTEEIDAHVRAAEEFFILPYLGFIQNIVGRVRTIVLGMLSLFVAVTLCISSYPFDPLPTIGAIFLMVFVLIGTTVTFVYAGMHRDATLSHITRTVPGELGFDFWIHIVTFGIGPVIGLLTTLFPAITDFVVSFLQPGSEAMR